MKDSSFICELCFSSCVRGSVGHFIYRHNRRSNVPGFWTGTILSSMLWQYRGPGKRQTNAYTLWKQGFEFYHYLVTVSNPDAARFALLTCVPSCVTYKIGTRHDQYALFIFYICIIILFVYVPFFSCWRCIRFQKRSQRSNSHLLFWRRSG